MELIKTDTRRLTWSELIAHWTRRADYWADTPAELIKAFARDVDRHLAGLATVADQREGRL